MFRDSTVFPDHVPTTIQTSEDGTRIALGGGATTMWNDAKGYGLYIGKMRYIRLDTKRRKT